MLTAFPKGLYAHVRGFRFALAHKGYLLLTAIPFVLTLALFGVGVWLFAAHDDRLLALVWSPKAAGTGEALGVLYWLYVHVAKALLYGLVFVLSYFLFMVVANILASPVYDAIAGGMVRKLRGDGGHESALPWWRVMLEQAKQAIFVAALPLLLVFVPVVGQLLAPLVAAALLAFEFIDFAFARDEPRFAVRLKAMVGRPLTLLGFGLPLLVPVLNIVLFPCAICGATLLYLDGPGRGNTPSAPK